MRQLGGVEEYTCRLVTRILTPLQWFHQDIRQPQRLHLPIHPVITSPASPVPAATSSKDISTKRFLQVSLTERHLAFTEKCITLLPKQRENNVCQ